MASLATDILIVGGGAAGMSAALSASETGHLSVTMVDDNPYLGGQIWRAEMGRTKSPDALKLIDGIDSGRISVRDNAQVFASAGENSLAAETPDGRIEFDYKTLIIATGARERFLPFQAGQSPAFSVRAACRQWSKVDWTSKMGGPS